MTDKLEALSQPVAYTFDEQSKPLYSQEYVTALLAALEEKDQRIKELGVTQMTGPLSIVLRRAAELERIIEGVDQLAIDGGWTARGASEYAKSLETRNAELERANAAQDDHINQQQDRIDTLEKRNDELGKHVGKVEKLLKGTEESLIASVDRGSELEQRLQQPIKLPKREIGMACEFMSDHVVVSLATVLVEAATSGFKAEVEGE